MATSSWCRRIGGVLALLAVTACGGAGGVGVDGSIDSNALSVPSGETLLSGTRRVAISCDVPRHSFCSSWLGPDVRYEDVEAGCPEGATASTEVCPTDGGFGQCSLSRSGSDDEMRTTYYEGWPDALKPSLVDACERGGGRWRDL